MANGQSQVEVTSKLGPGGNSDVLNSFESGIRENGGLIELSSGASARLISVEIVSPGMP